METLKLAPVASRPKKRDAILWLVLVALAALLRLGPITSGLPYSDYVDEGHILHPAIGLLNSRNFDSRLYTYPPLTSYLTVAAITGYAPVYQMFHHRKLWKDLPTDQDFHTNLGDHYDLLTPPEIIWLGRLVVACLSIGTVIVAGALAEALGGSRAGLLAMLFTALCPALVSRGSIVIIDTTATFFVVATLFFCQRLRCFAALHNPAMWRQAAFAGLAAGLAFGGKYTVGIVFAAVFVTILTLPLTKKAKAILTLIAGGGLFCGVFLGVPTMVLRPDKIIEELRSQAAFYQTIQSDQGYWSAAFSRGEIGFPLMSTGLVAIVWMFLNPSMRRVAVSWTAFALPLLATVVWSSFQPFRNLLSLVPPLCVAAALLCNWLYEHLEHRSRRPFFSWPALALILIVSLPLAWSSGLQIQRRTSHIDSRVRAIDWLAQNARKEETVLGIRELSILSAEWKRIAAKSTVVPWFEASDLLRRQRFDYIVTAEFDLRHASDPKAWSAYRDGWNATISTLPPMADFGRIPTPVVPYLWRTNDERILILRGNAQ